jgi:RNA polymerase sigma factor (sigma-70 family)
MSGDEPTGEGRRDFATTHWSVVVAARHENPQTAREALAQLCEAYWYPLYAYIRRRTNSVQDAQDLTQEFFARLFEQRLYATADPERGRFRAFLLTACKRFVANEWHKARTVRRGGGRPLLTLDFDAAESKLGVVAVDKDSPEELYDRQWAIALLEQVLEQLRAEYAAKGRLPHFETLKCFLTGSPEGATYANAARALGISETTAKVAVHRMRRRYRELLRSEIGQTVERPEEVDDEIRHLFAVLGSEKSGGRP